MSATSEANRLPVELKVDALLAEVNGELAQLEPQYNRLRALRERLTGSATPARAKNSGTATPVRRSREGGTRLEQFMQVIIAEPGLQIPVIAERMGVQPNYLYRVRERAKAENLIRMDGSNIFPIEASAPVAA